MATERARDLAKPGDLVEAQGLPGKPTRCGEIVEVLGQPGHEHYRVRWDEQHESLLFPADGVRIVPRAARRRRPG
jgi:hypothetical protein